MSINSIIQIHTLATDSQWCALWWWWWFSNSEKFGLNKLSPIFFSLL